MNITLAQDPRRVIICDLDNCLVDDQHRIPLIDWAKPAHAGRYDAYHAACKDDGAPHAVVMGLIAAEVRAGAAVAFFTARPEAYRMRTQNWLNEKVFGPGTALWAVGLERTVEWRLEMRGDNDHRKSAEVKRAMLKELLDPNCWGFDEVVLAMDDRDDVLEMYRETGIPTLRVRIHDTCAYTPPGTTPARDAADILVAMAETYRERNAAYGSNFRMVGKLMGVLFPDGVPPGLATKDQFHLFELVLVKLSRFAISNLSHQDSIHDAGVYAAMIEALVIEQEVAA